MKIRHVIRSVRQAKNSTLKSNPFCEKARFSIEDVMFLADSIEKMEEALTLIWNNSDHGQFSKYIRDKMKQALTEYEASK